MNMICCICVDLYDFFFVRCAKNSCIDFILFSSRSLLNRKRFCIYFNFGKRYLSSYNPPTMILYGAGGHGEVYMT